MIIVRAVLVFETTQFPEDLVVNYGEVNRHSDYQKVK